MVAAGAIVTRDVPAYALVMGGPARQRGWVCRCGSRLRSAREPLECDMCGRRYEREGGGLITVDDSDVGVAAVAVGGPTQVPVAK